jgi:hypothetical protein
VGQGSVPDAADVALALDYFEGDRGRLEMLAAESPAAPAPMTQVVIREG